MQIKQSLNAHSQIGFPQLLVQYMMQRAIAFYTELSSWKKQTKKAPQPFRILLPLQD